jgi:hypothetical protein
MPSNAVSLLSVVSGRCGISLSKKRQYYYVAIVLLPLVHTCNHRLKCNTYFRLSCIIWQHVSASLGHYQVYTRFLKFLHCHLKMSRVKALLFFMLKSSKVRKIADSASLHPVVRCVCTVCSRCVRIWTPWGVGLFYVCTGYVLLPTCFTLFLIGLLFYPENGGDMFLRNVVWLSTNYMTLRVYPRRQTSS